MCRYRAGSSSPDTENPGDSIQITGIVKNFRVLHVYHISTSIYCGKAANRLSNLPLTYQYMLFLHFKMRRYCFITKILEVNPMVRIGSYRVSDVFLTMKNYDGWAWISFVVFVFAVS